MSQQETPLEALEAIDREPEPSKYDQELGRFAGEDAKRVWRGELSKAEFFELYDEAFREEFGEDYVPPEGMRDE